MFGDKVRRSEVNVCSRASQLHMATTHMARRAAVSRRLRSTRCLRMASVSHGAKCVTLTPKPEQGEAYLLA